MFRRLVFKDQTGSLAARMARSREEGYLSGAREAKLCRLAMAGAQRQEVLDWLNTAIDAGRAELEAQHALEREIDAWDMSCRIMFMVVITHQKMASFNVRWGNGPTRCPHLALSCMPRTKSED